MITIKLISLALALCTLSASATDRDAVNLKTHISGASVNQDEAFESALNKAIKDVK